MQQGLQQLQLQVPVCQVSTWPAHSMTGFRLHSSQCAVDGSLTGLKLLECQGVGRTLMHADTGHDAVHASRIAFCSVMHAVAVQAALCAATMLLCVLTCMLLYVLLLCMLMFDMLLHVCFLRSF